MTLFSVKEVATQFGVNPHSVYRMIAAGTLRGHRLGLGRGTLRISQDEIRRYLDSSGTDRLPDNPEEDEDNEDLCK